MVSSFWKVCGFAVHMKTGGAAFSFFHSETRFQKSAFSGRLVSVTIIIMPDACIGTPEQGGCGCMTLSTGDKHLVNVISRLNWREHILLSTCFMEGSLFYILTLDVSCDLWKHLITSLRRELQHKSSRFFVFVGCGTSVTIEAVSWDWALLNNPDWTTPAVYLSPLFLPLRLLTQSDYFPLAALHPSLLSLPLSISLRLSPSFSVSLAFSSLHCLPLHFAKQVPWDTLCCTLYPPSLSPCPSLSLFSSLSFPLLSLPLLLCLSAILPPHLTLSINNLLCHSCSAGQFSLVSISLSSSSDLLCRCHSLAHVSLVTVHWALYYPHSHVPPSLSPSPCCLISYYCCWRFVSPRSVQLKCFSSAMSACSIGRLRVASSFSFVHISVQGELFSQCYTRSGGIAISVSH